ncbi:hypothetical protein RRG08_004552, partial [Elysia crispata]
LEKSARHSLGRKRQQALSMLSREEAYNKSRNKPDSREEVNIQSAESAIAADNITLHSDGTSRDGKKIVGHQMSVDDGCVFYLDFAPVASEDA